MSGASAAVIAGAIVRRQQKIVETFRAAGATTPERATTAAALQIDEGMAFRLLCSHQVLKEAGEQRLYLDEAAWEAHGDRRRKTALIVMGTVLVVLAGLLIWAFNR